MPLDAAQLQVTIGANVAPLLSAMSEGSAAVSSSADRMVMAFKSVGAESNATVGRIEQNNERTAALFNEQAAAATQMGYSVREARGSTRLLADELGLHLNRELQGTLSRSDLIGPALAGAFNAFALVGFVEVLGQIPSTIDKIIGEVAGWDAEAQKTYDDLVKGNIRLVASTAETQNQIRDLNQIGKEGMAKFAMASKDNAENLHTLAAASAELMHSLNGANAELMKLQSWDNRAVQAIGLASGEYEDRVKNLKSYIAELTSQIDALDKQQRELQGPKKDRDAAEQAVAAAQANRDLLVAEADHFRTYASSVETYDRAMYEARFKDGEIFLAQKTQLDLESLQREEEAAEESYKRLRAIKEQEGRSTGKDVRPELENMDAAEEKRRMEHSQKVLEINSSLKDQLDKQAEQYATAVIEADAKVMESKLHLAEITQRATFENSGSPAAVEAAAIPLIETTNKLYEAQIGALQKRIELLSAEPATPENKTQLVDLNSQEETLRNQGLAAVQEIENQKTDAIMRSYDRQESYATESANRQLEIAMRADEESLKHHEISVQQEVSAEKAALDRWRDEQTAALKAAMDFAASTYGKEGNEYQKLQQKKEQLDQEYASKSAQIVNKQEEQWQQITRKMGATFESTMTKMAMGEESWAKISKQLYGEVASQFVTNSVKMVEQEVVAAITHKSLLKTEILGDAKTAAAGAYKAMASIPIVGPELGAITAATTFAAVMALGSFETGGLARETGLTFCTRAKA
jgi:hypothetical protein